MARFCELVTSSLTADSAHPHPLTELPDQVTEYEYELDEKTGKTSPTFSLNRFSVLPSPGERVVLGRGAFGTVYSAVDSVTKRKMAVKEIKESDSG